MHDHEGEAKLSEKAYLPVASGIGFYDGFFGPGTGQFFAITLVSLRGFGLTRATGLTKLFNLTSNLASLAVFAIGGQIMVVLGLCMAIGGKIHSSPAGRGQPVPYRQAGVGLVRGMNQPAQGLLLDQPDEILLIDIGNIAAHDAAAHAGGCRQFADGKTPQGRPRRAKHLAAALLGQRLGDIIGIRHHQPGEGPGRVLVERDLLFRIHRHHADGRPRRGNLHRHPFDQRRLVLGR
ncbi:hypothetical protein E4T56_gene15789, partial [Termitomyces sp. T112]